MKKILFIILILLISQVCFAGRLQEMQKAVIAAKNGATPPATFCAGTELFCEDFEGEDTTWDNVTGQVDCVAYDTANDYCDDDLSDGTYAEVMGFYGSTSGHIDEALSSASSEVTITMLYKSSNVATTYFARLYNTTNPHIVLSLQTSTGGLLRIVANNNTVTNTASTNAFSVDTWYALTIYYKEETAAENNDGVLKAKIGSTEVISVTNLDSGQGDAEQWRFYSNNSAGVVKFKNVKVVSGNSY